MSPLVTKVRGDISPKKSLAFTATESEYLRQFLAFRTDIPLNETLGAPDILKLQQAETLFAQKALLLLF